MPTLQDGQNAIAQGNLQQARLIFEALLQENTRNEQAWLGLAQVLPDTEDKRICYENVLKIDKGNEAAKEGLRHLEPQADPLVMALAPQPVEAFEEEETEFREDDSTMISPRPDFGAPAAEESGTPTVVLVAVGLALSVVVFAVGGGVFYFLINALTGR
ncbi:MAG: tetratricopeptide repeat protein [Chloroflexota bacterium]